MFRMLEDWITKGKNADDWCKVLGLEEAGVQREKRYPHRMPCALTLSFFMALGPYVMHLHGQF